MYFMKICQRNDIEANWRLYNPVLLEGEVAFSTDVYNIKIGDGVSNWSDLPYYIESLTDEEILKLCK